MDGIGVLSSKERHLLVLREAHLQCFTAEERSVAGHLFFEAPRRTREARGEASPSPQELLDEALKIARTTIEEPSAPEAIKAGARRFLELADKDPPVALAGAYWSLAWTDRPFPEGERPPKRPRKGLTPPWEYRRSPGAIPSAGVYSGTGKAGRCNPAYPTVCVPRPHPIWTARTSPARALRFFPLIPTGWTGTGRG